MDAKKDLKIYSKSVKSTKAKAYQLKNGNRYYDTVTREVKIQKVLGNTGSALTRSTSNTGINYSGLISDSVRKMAKKIVGNSTGIPAAKKLAKWVARNIKSESRAGFYQSPATTLKRKRGNCCSHVDLFFHMCDAVGVTRKYNLYYIHVGTMKFGKRHFFGKINGVYVDPASRFKDNPWGHAGFGHRSIYQTKKYPELPLPRKY